MLKMPSRNGRTATVIFPPGNESIEDIKYMLDCGDVANVDIQVVQQVRLAGTGQGCQLFSTAMES